MELAGTVRWSTQNNSKKKNPSELILASGLYSNNASDGRLTQNTFMLLGKGIRI